MNYEAELVASIKAVIPALRDDQAAALAAAAEPMWTALEPYVDAFGGAEFLRTFPAALRAILVEANGALPEGAATPEDVA